MNLEFAVEGLNRLKVFQEAQVLAKIVYGRISDLKNDYLLDDEDRVAAL